MNSLEMQRLLKGYVRFNASNGFYERFINLCAVNQAGLWDVHVDKNGVCACIAAKDYRTIREYAVTSGCKLNILAKHGLPFFARNNRNRIGVPIGLAVFVTFLAIMTSFIWCVEVDGCESLDEETVEGVFEDLGVRIGRRKSSVDMRYAQSQAQIILDEYIYWASLNVEGCTVRIEIKEYPETEKPSSFGSPCNVVADFDGIIKLMSVTGGRAAISVGSGVRKGDLLISGVIENTDLSTSMYEASGTVVAEHKRTLEYAVGAIETFRQYISYRTVYEINFFGLTLPLGFAPHKESECFEDEYIFIMGETELPLSVTSRIYTQYDIADVPLSEQQQKLLAVDGYITLLKREFSNTAVISRTLNVDKTEQKLIIKDEAKCLDFMGVQKRILTEN